MSGVASYDWVELSRVREGAVERSAGVSQGGEGGHARYTAPECLCQCTGNRVLPDPVLHAESGGSCSTRRQTQVTEQSWTTVTPCASTGAID